MGRAAYPGRWKAPYSMILAVAALPAHSHARRYLTGTSIPGEPEKTAARIEGAIRAIVSFSNLDARPYFGASYGSTRSMSERMPRSCGENCPW